ncbi:MAG: hypothetical protein BMS9Abin20_1057 [Acidimicrobiia bacterium]|nr:MAG: hypothetical protein BMS9Abin20_1057 [Acidimicrobiia bacterium]
MMRVRLAVVVGGILAVLVSLPAPAQAVTVSVVELLEDGAAYAGQEITVVGELVGDYGFRRDGWMWTQLNTDSYAIRPIVEGGPLRGPNFGIGVRMPAELGRDLDPPGRYRMLGPVVVVTGIWRYHDEARQGETFLDITSLELQIPGRSLSEDPDWVLYGLGAALFVIAGITGLSYVRKRDSVG